MVLKVASEDGVEQSGLPQLQGDEPGEHIEEVDQVAGVFVRPVVGLNVAERGGRAAVADDGARAVALILPCNRRL